MRHIFLRAAVAYGILLLVNTYQGKIAMYASVNQQPATALASPQYEKNTAYQAARTKYHDLLHTKLEVNFSWQDQHLHGVATLGLQPHCFPQRNLVLDAQSFVIHSIYLVEDSIKNLFGV